jgi:hypothetical protein
MAENGFIKKTEFANIFLRELLLDVESANHNFRQQDTSFNRRTIIRSVFAAIEGSIWIYRTHITELAELTYELEHDQKAALLEAQYFIESNGDIKTLKKFSETLSIFRLITKVAQKIAPDIQVNFSSAGWENLKKTSQLRNRLMHPKQETDLIVELQEIESAQKALLWLLESISSVMMSVKTASSAYNMQLRDLTDQLQEGDAEVINLYRKVLSQT